MNFPLFKNRPFLQAGLLAFPLLIFIFLLGKYSVNYSQGVENCPSNVEQGYQQPIIAFEFARTAQDIEKVLGCFSTEQIRQIDLANRIDYGFMFFYSLFLFLFFRVAHQRFQQQVWKWALILPLLTFFGDLFENLQLFELTELYRNGNSESMETPLFWLQVTTWTKWLALAAALASCGGVYMKFNWNMKFNWISTVIGCLCFLPIGLGIMALSNHNVIAINNFIASIFGVFFLVIIWSWVVEVKLIRN